MLKAPPGARPVAELVNGFYRDSCPVYRSLKNGIEMSSSVAVVPAE